MTKQEKLELIIEKLAYGKQSQFARDVGESPSNISKWIKRETYDAEIILATYPDLSAEWLMRGTEPMLLSELKQKEADTTSVDLHQALDLIKSQAQTIQNLHTLLDHYLEDTKPKDTL